MVTSKNTPTTETPVKHPATEKPPSSPPGTPKATGGSESPSDSASTATLASSPTIDPPLLTPDEIRDLATAARIAMMSLAHSVDQAVGSEIVEVGRHMSGSAAQMTGGSVHQYQPHYADPTRRISPTFVLPMLVFHCAAVVRLYGDIIRAGAKNHGPFDAAFKQAVDRIKDFAHEPFDPSRFEVHGTSTTGFALERKK